MHVKDMYQAGMTYAEAAAEVYIAAAKLAILRGWLLLLMLCMCALLRYFPQLLCFSYSSQERLVNTMTVHMVAAGGRAQHVHQQAPQLLISLTV